MATPYFTRDEAARIMAYNDEHIALLDGEHFRWEGDTIVSTHPEYPGDDYRMDPIVDDEGVQRWGIGAGSWTWQSARDLCSCCRDANTYTQGLCPWCIEACSADEHVPYADEDDAL